MGKPRHEDTLPVTVAGGPRIFVSALVLRELISVGKTQAEHYDHPALGPTHRPKMEVNPRGGLDNHSSHPLPSDTSQDHTPTIYNECTHPSPARPHRGAGGTLTQKSRSTFRPPDEERRTKERRTSNAKPSPLESPFEAATPTANT